MYAVVIPDGGAHTLSPLVYLFLLLCLIRQRGGKRGGWFGHWVFL